MDGVQVVWICSVWHLILRKKSPSSLVLCLQGPDGVRIGDIGQLIAELPTAVQ
jgi:hypothetical protein